jgi:hypothetical protein
MSYSVNTSYEKYSAMLNQSESAKIRSVGRKRRWAEDMQARFREGTFARIKAALDKGEAKTDFLRAAVDRELARREAERKKRK